MRRQLNVIIVLLAAIVAVLVASWLDVRGIVT